MTQKAVPTAQEVAELNQQLTEWNAPAQATSGAVAELKPKPVEQWRQITIFDLLKGENQGV